MATIADVKRTRAVTRMRDGAVSVAALLLSFAAFDDITTGHETDFTLEYGALLVCAGWLLFMTLRLMRASHRALGSASLVALAGALWAQREIGSEVIPGWPAYAAIATAFLWFAGVAVFLLVSGWRGRSRDRRRDGSATGEAT
jgi:hypothetical protein